MKPIPLRREYNSLYTLILRDVSKAINLIPGEQVDNKECHVERHFVFTEEHCVSSKRTPEQDTGIVTLTRSPAFRECMKSFLGRKWQPTPAYLPGKSHAQRSLLG